MCVCVSESVMSAVQSRCKKLFDRLLSDVDAECCGHNGKGSLARRLGLGLHKLMSVQHTTHGYTNSKVKHTHNNRDVCCIKTHISVVIFVCVVV